MHPCPTHAQQVGHPARYDAPFTTASATHDVFNRHRRFPTRRFTPAFDSPTRPCDSARVPAARSMHRGSGTRLFAR
jgi:hypothetical protein